MSEEKSLTLIEHLDELRTRLIRIIIYVASGMTICWLLYPFIFKLLEQPVIETIGATGGTLQVLDIMEPFWVRTQISLVTGIALALPLLLLEIWGFVRPALTSRERRVIRTVPLVVVILFLFGAGFGYWMCSLFVKWLLSDYFLMPGMKAQLRVQGTILFMAKVLLAFGIGFQLPILIIILNRLGILPMSLLSRRWREATMVIAICAALITPSWDPISMTIAAMPLALLYLGTLGIIKLLERRDRKEARRQKE